VTRSVKTYLVFLVMAFVPLSNAQAQEAYVATIGTRGTATVGVKPTQVSFWIHRVESGRTHAEAMHTAESFESDLNAALDQRDLRPQRLRLHPPAVRDINSPTVEISAELRFGMIPFLDVEDGSALFAKLLDMMKTVADESKALIEGPFLSAEAAKTVAEEAVKLAMEDAYRLGEAAALSMDSAIFGVDSVAVVSIVWNDDPELRAAQPDLRTLRCTATVDMTYASAPPTG